MDDNNKNEQRSGQSRRQQNEKVAPRHVAPIADKPIMNGETKAYLTKLAPHAGTRRVK